MRESVRRDDGLHSENKRNQIAHREVPEEYRL